MDVVHWLLLALFAPLPILLLRSGSAAAVRYARWVAIGLASVVVRPVRMAARRRL
ncbi:MAG TPA: hypothetical protein VEK07_00745 [Polyangiaceae bacterium]|nr:hypothetical protein [Polyangiaceae bacterium]